MANPTPTADAPHQRLRVPYQDPKSPWLTTHDGGDSEEFIAWAKDLRESEAPEGALEISLVDLIVQAARRLKRVTRDLEADGYRDRNLVRELTACERSWSKALAEWRRHRASKYAKERAKAKAQAKWDQAKAKAEATLALGAKLLSETEGKAPLKSTPTTQVPPKEAAKPASTTVKQTPANPTGRVDRRLARPLSPWTFLGDRADEVLPITAAVPQPQGTAPSKRENPSLSGSSGGKLQEKRGNPEF